MALPLTCPGCQEQMIEVDDAGVIVDVCPSCGGLWLDAGELEQKGGRMPAIASRRAGTRSCPLCVRPMEMINVGRIELDRCGLCRGIFFDPDEIEGLLRVEPAGAAAGAAAGATMAAAAAAAAVPVSNPSQPPTGSYAEPDVWNEPKAPSFFWCDFCKQRTPVEEQVMGELVTLCPTCAKRHDIRHDPKARRRAEKARERESAPRFEDAFGGSRSRGWHVYFRLF